MRQHSFKRTTSAIISVLLLLSATVKGQQYNTFIYNNLFGIVSKDTKEIVAPAYDWNRTVSGREEYLILHPPVSSEAPTLKFNMSTGSKQFFDTYYSNELQIRGIPYSFAVRKEKRYLVNEETGDSIILKEEFRDFTNAGTDFIIARFYPKPEKIKAVKSRPQPVKKNKSGAIPPPPEIERLPPPPSISDLSISDYAVLNNDTTINILLHVKAAFFKPYYFFDEDDHIQEIDHNANPPGFVAGTGNSQTIYDTLLKPVKALKLKLNIDKYSNVLDSESEDILLQECSRVLGKKTVFRFAVHVSAPSAIHNTREEKSSERTAYLSRQNENGITLVYLNQAEGRTTRLFETRHKVRLDKDDNVVYINPDSKTGMAAFEINMETGRLLLPEKYIRLLELKVY